MNHHPGSVNQNRSARRLAGILGRLRAAVSGPTYSSARSPIESLEERMHYSKTPSGVPVLDAANNLTFYGTKKADVITIARPASAGGHVVITLNGVAVDVGTPASIKVLAGGGKDKVSVVDHVDAETNSTAGVVGPVTIDGGSGDDALTGGVSNDTLIGGKGKDVLIGGDGNDYLDGGSDNDTLIGGTGDDTLIGGSGKNKYNGGTGNNVDDSGRSKKNVISPAAVAPSITSTATPLSVFGDVSGLTPTEIRNQYGFGNLSDPTYTNRGDGQAIAVVIPYDVKQVRISVNAFSTQFGLPQVDTNNLEIIDATGTTTPDDPDPNHGWEAEACLAIEQAHSIAPNAQLYLVLADSDLFTDLFTAVDKAVDTVASRFGGGTVLMTFGSQTGELNPALQAYLDQSFTRRAAKNVTFVTGSGDAGTVSYPSVSPYVVSVGGSSLQRDTLGTLTGNESGWTRSGGGISATYPAPGFQTGTLLNGVTLPRRATPDISFNADPASGVALYVAEGFGDVDGDGVLDSGWLPGGAGGTSAAAPAIAGLVALANQQRTATGRDFLGQRFNDAVYDLNRTYPASYINDITTPTTNPTGGPVAGTGYDLLTGIGTPKAQILVDRLATAGDKAISFSKLKWNASFEEAITKTGPLNSAGGGFINGSGNVAGNNSLTANLVPRDDLTPQDPTFPSGSGTSGASGTSGNNITGSKLNVTNFTPFNLIRTASNYVEGTARVDVTILLIPVAVPTPSVPDNNASTGGTGTSTTPTPTPVPGLFVAGLDDSQPPNVNGEIRTWRINLKFRGNITRDKNGQEHLTGEFINANSLYNPGGDPVQGLEPIFRGTVST